MNFEFRRMSKSLISHVLTYNSYQKCWLNDWKENDNQLNRQILLLYMSSSDPGMSFLSAVPNTWSLPIHLLNLYQLWQVSFPGNTANRDNYSLLWAISIPCVWFYVVYIYSCKVCLNMSSLPWLKRIPFGHRIGFFSTLSVCMCVIFYLVQSM